MIPYTYLIGWTEYNKWYYGVRYARNCDPSDLWKSYKTSSKYVKRFYNKHGDPDVIKIRRTFDNIEKARYWEHKVLKRMKILKDERFLNKTDNMSIIHDVPHSEEAKKLMSEKKKGKSNLKLRGRKYSDEHKQKISLSKIGKPSLLRGKPGKSSKFKGIKGRYSEDILNLISEKTKESMNNFSIEKKTEIYLKRDNCNGRIWINDGIKYKRVKPNDLNFYLEQGWFKGKINIKRDHNGQFI